MVAQQLLLVGGEQLVEQLQLQKEDYAKIKLVLKYSSLLMSRLQMENADQVLRLKLIPGPKFVQVEKRVIDFSLDFWGIQQLCGPNLTQF